MANISYIKLRESEVDNIVSKKDKVQDLHLNQLKLNVNNAYKKDEKISTNFEPSDDTDVINKAYLDKQLSKTDGQICYIEEDYNEFKLNSDKLSIEEVLIQRAVKTTIQILYDKGLFDKYDIADDILTAFFIHKKTIGFKGSK